MKLSILIPTLPQRHRFLRKLMEQITTQIDCDAKAATIRDGQITVTTYTFDCMPVEVIVMLDNKQISVGKKRNLLKALAKGEYLTYVDDDDKISSDYISTIVAATKTGKDLITYRVEMIENGAVSREVHYHPRYTKDMDVAPSLKTLPKEQQEKLEGKSKAAIMRAIKKQPAQALRVPNHLMVWKRSLTSGCQFPDISLGEDGAWALKMKPRVSNLHEIDKVLYWYMFDATTTETQR